MQVLVVSDNESSVKRFIEQYARDNKVISAYIKYSCPEYEKILGTELPCVHHKLQFVTDEKLDYRYKIRLDENDEDIGYNEEGALVVPVNNGLLIDMEIEDLVAYIVF